jgi:bifunctional DNase/RNase
MSDEPTPVSDDVTEPLDPVIPHADASDEVDPDTLKFNVMSVESVLFDLSDSSPLVHLIEDETPYRYLAIPIALAEAVALHNALDKIDGRRPGTHEVMAEVLRRLSADIVAARITRYDAGVFYAELDLMTPKGHEIFDCRTSDALILATRQGVRAPVLCAESVLQAFYA